MASDDDKVARSRTVTATAALDDTSPLLPEELPVGAALGRYVVLERLGAGGMGVVYAASDSELGRKVAIKLLRAGAHVDQQRLRREAQAMARLQHPNVLAVYDVGLFADRAFIAMELVEGTTLTAWMAAEPRPWRDIVAMFAQAGRGLAAAHAVGLVHRDFKPANVLVGRDGRPRVGDFGLARARLADDSGDGGAADETAALTTSSPSLDVTLTKTGALVGTPSYMAPEQFQHRPADARSDQFSFCVALYRALYGQPPFAGSVLGEIAASVTAGRVEPAPRDSGVPAWLHKLVLRGLATDPAARWPSMDALLAELARDPAAERRRRIAAIGAVTAVVALAVGGYAAVQWRHRALCGGAAAELAGVWDAGRRQAVRDSFRATGVPFAEAAFDGVARALDGFAAGWVQSRTDACTATRIRGVQSEELLDARIECLAERRAQTQALVDLFSHADAPLVTRAAKLSANVGDLSECSDVARLRSPVRLPTDAAARAQVAALRQRLARIRALLDAGKFDEALPLSQAAVDEATKLGHAPTRAAALWTLGTLQWEKGKEHDAEATFVAAAAAAVRGRDDTLAARSWTSLVRLDGGDLARFDDADRWALFADAVIERLGDDDLRASFLQARGTVALIRARYDESLADAKQVLQIREKRSGPESVAVADALDVLGNALYYLTRNDESLRAHQRALALRIRLQGADHPDVAVTLDSLASVLQVLGRYDEELADFKRALAIWQRTRGPESPDVALVLDNIGLALAMKERLTESLDSHRKALAIFDRIGDVTTGRAIATGNVGDRLMQLHRDAEAVGYLERSLAMEEKLLGPTHRELGWILSSLGELHLRQHDARAAVPVLERAVAIWTHSHIPRFNLGHTRFVLARALWERGDEVRARAVVKEAQADLQADSVPESKKELAEADAWLAGRAR